MPISPDRIRKDIDAIAAFTQTPGAGATRPTFSPEWRGARDYVESQLRSIGSHTRIDAAGNLHARPGTIAW
ncbi:MAG: Zn-dependent hydrolase, partial [Tepidisphaeraceae bacterium]